MAVRFIQRKSSNPAGYSGNAAEIQVDSDTNVLKYNSNGTVYSVMADVQVSTTFNTADLSYQIVPADLTVGTTAGSTTPATPVWIAPIMGNLLGDEELTTTHNYMGGLIGMYTLTEANAAVFPCGAVLAGIGDGVSETSNVSAFVAFLDGNTGAVNCEAMFKVKCVNSVSGTGPDFGLDLQDTAFLGHLAVDSAFYKKAPIRIAEDIVILVGTTTPTDGVAGTGLNVAGPGSLHLNTSDGKLRSNTNTKASPTWTVVGAQTA